MKEVILKKDLRQGVVSVCAYLGYFLVVSREYGNIFSRVYFVIKFPHSLLTASEDSDHAGRKLLAESHAVRV